MTPKFDSLGILIGLSKGYKVKSTKEKAQGWSLEEARLKLPAAFFNGATGHACFLSCKEFITTCVKCPVLGQLT